MRMFANYVRTSLRKFRSTKLHTSVNLTGLTLGLLCAIVIFQKVRFEESFDTFHEDPDRIFRIVREVDNDGDTDYGAGLQYPFVDAFRNDFPDVEYVSLVDRNIVGALITISHEDGSIDRFQQDNDAVFVEPDFVKIFHYDWIAGDPASAFSSPRTVAISRSLAEKYFGSIDVLGRLILFQNKLDLTVSGVFEDPPSNTELPFQMLISRNVGEDSDYERENDSWGSISSGTQVYVKLAREEDQAAVDRGLVDFIARYRDPEDASKVRHSLQPMTDIHFNPKYGSLRDASPVSRESVLTLKWIGIFLLLTAGINFVNLNIVLVFKRAKEVAVRKVMGGSARQVIAYFMTETGLSVMAALVLALLLANPAINLAKTALGDGFNVELFSDPTLLLSAIAVAVLLTLFSGFYPAVLLSRIEPALAIRGNLIDRPGSFVSLRRGLVVFQFAISQVFIICTIVAMQQMAYFDSAPLGYDTDAIVEFAVPTRGDGKIERLKETLGQNALINGFTYSNSGATSESTWASGMQITTDEDRIETVAQVKLVDHDYIDVYGMNLVAGADFVPGDSATGLIVNETFAHENGFQNPDDILGVIVNVWNWNNLPIIGVVQDFNTRSLHTEVAATMLIPTSTQAYVGAAKIGSSRIKESLAAIREAWEATYPDFLFESQFLDDSIAEMYEEEKATQALIQVFALIAILIGCIGLFGLISYTTSQRSREVGIRKVLGASAGNIVSLFSREFVIMVLLGFAISAPVAYSVMNSWLENFAYRIHFGAGIFLAGFALSLLIALATVGSKTFRAAQANPVDTISR